MGHSRLIPFVIEIVDANPNVRHTASEWRTRQTESMKRLSVPADGKPTPANILTYIESLEASTLPGGVNAHLGPMKVASARIKDQRSGQYVAEYRA